MKRMSVAVCIVTKDRWQELERAVRSVYAQRYQVDRILVWDNASVDREGLKAFEANHPSVEVHRSASNLGCPLGRNAVMGLVAEDVAVHVDDDGTLDRDAVALAVDALQCYERAGVIAFDVREHGKSLFPKWESDMAVASFCGGACAMLVRAFRQAGGYDEYILRQMEEVDLSIRLLEIGWGILFRKECLMDHLPRHPPKRGGEDCLLDVGNFFFVTGRRCPIWLWPTLAARAIASTYLQLRALRRRDLLARGAVVAIKGVLRGRRQSQVNPKGASRYCELRVAGQRDPGIMQNWIR